MFQTLHSQLWSLLSLGCSGWILRKLSGRLDSFLDMGSLVLGSVQDLVLSSGCVRQARPPMFSSVFESPSGGLYSLFSYGFACIGQCSRRYSFMQIVRQARSSVFRLVFESSPDGLDSLTGHKTVFIG